MKPAEELDPKNVSVAAIPNHRYKADTDKKLLELQESMWCNGWRGLPLIVKKVSGGYAAPIGSHRITVARELGIQVPAIVIDTDKPLKEAHTEMFPYDRRPHIIHLAEKLKHECGWLRDCSPAVREEMFRGMEEYLEDLGDLIRSWRDE